MSHSLPLPASARSAYLKNVSITSYLSTGFPCSKRRPWYIMRAQEQVGCYYSEAFDCPYKITNTFPAPMEYIWLIYTTKTAAFRCSLSLVLKLSKFQNRIIHLRSVTKKQCENNALLSRCKNRDKYPDLQRNRAITKQRFFALL